MYDGTPAVVRLPERAPCRFQPDLLEFRRLRQGGARSLMRPFINRRGREDSFQDFTRDPRAQMCGQTCLIVRAVLPVQGVVRAEPPASAWPPVVFPVFSLLPARFFLGARTNTHT